MDIIGSIVGSILSGGATGLLGILLQRWFDLKTKQLDIEVIKLNHANALALAQTETERTLIRADADMAIADRQAEAAEVQAAERSLQASYEHDKGTYLMPEAQKMKGWWGNLTRFMMALVDFARGMLRPGLTVYLTGITTTMFLHVMRMLEMKGHVWSSDDLTGLITQIVGTILYCTTTCVVWWFGTRPAQSNR